LLKPAIILLGMALSVYGQSQGPAILSHGDVPSGMVAPKIDFRPYLSLSAGYETGITGVSVTSAGSIPNAHSSSVQLGWGVSGTHSWRHTSLGLNYSGGLSHYQRASSFDSITQSFSLGLTRELTRHMTFTLRQSAGVFDRLTGFEGLRQTVPFDPSTTFIPTTEFYNNRTIYMGTQAGLTLQKTARLSFTFGGGAFFTLYRTQALKGTKGLSSYGDMQYRLSRRSTVGAMYQFSTFHFTGIYGDSYIHGTAATVGYQLSQRLEFSGFFGLMRAESKFVQSVSVDPAIAALLGISSARLVAHSVATRPYWSGRLSRRFSRGVVYVSAGQSVAPGNGLFLTSYTTSLLGGYDYTGLRRWSLNVNGGHTMAKSVGNIAGGYDTTTAGIGVSRQIVENLHFAVRYGFRQYGSSSFSGYNRSGQYATLGIFYSPGVVPLRLW
jgi:hypothetical protein